MKRFYSLSANGNQRVRLPNGNLSRFFFIKEFRNQDRTIDEIAIDDSQVQMLELTREHFGEPIFIQVANRNLPASSYHNPRYGNSCATDIDIGNTELGTVDYKKVCQYLEEVGAREIGCYDYTDINGKHTHFIHMDMGGILKKFWVCTGINPDGSQKLTYIKTFIPAPVIPFPVPTRNLRWIRKTWIFRMKGNDVRWVQTALNLVNKDVGVRLDGDFASQTDAAVRKFQTDYKIDIDGEVGPQTINKIKEVLGI